MPSLDKCMILASQVNFDFGIFLPQASQTQNLQHLKGLALKTLTGQCSMNSSSLSVERASFTAEHLKIGRFEPGKTTSSILESLVSKNLDCSKGGRNWTVQNAASLIGDLSRIPNFFIGFNPFEANLYYPKLLQTIYKMYNIVYKKVIFFHYQYNFYDSS